MSEHDQPEPKPFKIQSEDGVDLQKNADGSLTARAKKPVSLNIESIKSVGLENLVHVELHTINRVFNSVSHYVRFYGGGEVRFSYNSQGELLEFTCTNVDAEVRNGERILLKRREG
jgi:hypothetical protein